MQELQQTLSSGIVFVSNARIVDEDEEASSLPKRKHLQILLIMLLILLITGAVVGSICSVGTCSGNDSTAVSNSKFGTSSARPSPIPDTATRSPSTDLRTTLLVDFINNVSLAGRPIIYPAPASATAEEKALQWIIEDNLVADIITYIDYAPTRERLVQRYALVVLWFYSNGESWKETQNWLVST